MRPAGRSLGGQHAHVSEIAEDRVIAGLQEDERPRMGNKNEMQEK